MPKVLVRDLKSSLEASEATWMVNPALKDDDELPQFRTGATSEGLPLAQDVTPLNFGEVLRDIPANPFVLERRVATGIVSREQIQEQLKRPLQRGVLAPSPVPDGGAPLTMVDWRNRWGWPWITSVRDQNGCNACWVFASVALVESMVRIEHCVWPWLSEGDVHKGMGAQCATTGNISPALQWIHDHGVADPGCFPWTTGNVAYTPTPDRSGRSVRTPNVTWVGSVNDQKKWLDTVGPLATWFNVWADFFSYGSGVYRKQAVFQGQPNHSVAGHFMLIVGYDDAQQCWIVKNSWGPNWGNQGYVRIGYGETEIDLYSKAGLSGVSPDPWTKRRLHSGNLYESSRGATYRNFVILAASGHQARQWWRDNAASGFPWKAGPVFGNDVASVPTLTGTTYNRNLECVYLTTGRRLHHWWMDANNMAQWNDGGIFGPADAAGVPGFIQANYGAPGNFEMVVRTADSRLNHWWRDNTGGNNWHNGGRFGKNVAFSGATLIQSHYWDKGNFELVCVLKTGQMQHWWRDNDHGNVWHAGPLFGASVKSSPCMIEASYGEMDEKGIGNFELCVAVNGHIEHWWRNNSGGMNWLFGAAFGQNVAGVVGLCQSSFSFNLELIVQRTDGKLQHYWRDGGGWHDGGLIA